MYIDRIVIKEEYRRKGIANHLYSLIEEIASELGSPLCCEVNTFPENKPSIEFHKKLGFIDIGKNSEVIHLVLQSNSIKSNLQFISPENGTLIDSTDLGEDRRMFLISL